MRARGEANASTFWLFVEAPRLLFVGVLFLGVLLGLVIVGVAVPEAAQLLRNGDPIETTFQSFLGATITGVTLVLTLNQLVLSQELGAVGDQRERMEGAMSFREDVASVTDDAVVPAEPAAFLRALVLATADRAQTVADGIETEQTQSDDTSAAAEIERLADTVEQNAMTVGDRLADAQFGTFDLLSAALDFDYSLTLYRTRLLRNEHEAELSETQIEALDDLAETLRLFGPAREHFKTLYFQWELVTLSRVILASSIPAILVTASMVLYYDVGLVGGLLLGVPAPILIVAGAVAVGVLPFLVLLAYILRIATVAKRTLSIGPFTLRDRSESD
jgi:hypothetical protein